MKKTLLLVLCLALVLVPFAAAQVTLVDTSAIMGGKTQRASNPLHEDGPRVEQVSGTIKFSLGSVPAAKLVIESITPDSKYSLDTSLSFSNLNAIKSALGSSKNLLVVELTEDLVDNATDNTIRLTSMVPANLDAIDPADLQQKSFKVATMTFKAVDPANPSLVLASGLGPFDLFIQRENNLDIDNIDAEINGAARKSIDNGDDIEDLSPGDHISIEVELRSRFDDSDEVDIENIVADLDVDTNDFDIDDKSLDFDLSPDDEESDTFQVDVEEDADDGTGRFDLTVSGTDENGALHGEAITFRGKVERKSHDIVIRSAVLNPAVLDCSVTAVTVQTEIVNLGKSEEDDVDIEVLMPDANYKNRVKVAGELDEDDTHTETFTIAVPANFKPGFHAVEINTFYDSKLSGQERLILENTCKPAETNGNGQTGTKPTTLATPLSLDRTSVRLDAGSSATVIATVTNTESAATDFTVTIANIEDFADAVAPKTVLLQPGQSTQLLFNIPVKSDADSGSYSATVRVQSGSGKTLESKNVAVIVEAAAEPEAQPTAPAFDTSKVFWIVLDIVLVVVAIFFIRLIFTTGRRSGKPAQRTLGDVEADAAKRRR